MQTIQNGVTTCTVNLHAFNSMKPYLNSDRNNWKIIFKSCNTIDSRTKQYYNKYKSKST